MSIAALGSMVYLSYFKADAYTWIGSLVYGVSMTLMYLTSVMYHGSSDAEKRKLLKKLDHIAIFVFIAATYTLPLLVLMPTTYGMIMLALIWATAVAGVFLKLSNIKLSKLVTSLPYLGMGWMIVLFIKPFMAVAPMGFLWYFLAGGVLYSGGVYFYVKHTGHNHAIWHLFVMLGTLGHFLGMFNFLYS